MNAGEKVTIVHDDTGDYIDTDAVIIEPSTIFPDSFVVETWDGCTRVFSEHFLCVTKKLYIEDDKLLPKQEGFKCFCDIMVVCNKGCQCDGY